ELFSALDELAKARGFAAVAYGVNADDTLDFRPGHRAAMEHQVLAPLLDAGLSKSEIRFLSRRAGLPTWDRPASACLASRLPYGTEVTPERLNLVERGEAALRDLGFRQFRVRLHDKLARVEISPEEMPRALAPEMAAAIAGRLKAAGFTYVALDLEGYRQGSLNETLSPVRPRAGRLHEEHNSLLLRTYNYDGSEHFSAPLRRMNGASSRSSIIARVPCGHRWSGQLQCRAVG